MVGVEIREENIADYFCTLKKRRENKAFYFCTPKRFCPNRIDFLKLVHVVLVFYDYYVVLFDRVVP